MTGRDTQKNHRHPERKRGRRSHGRTTQRRSEIESRRFITRQHSTARGASGRR
jgi:hypothetical protein